MMNCKCVWAGDPQYFQHMDGCPVKERHQWVVRLEQENAALRGEVEQWKCAAAEDRQFYREEREKRQQAEAALSRYRDAVEWACKRILAEWKNGVDAGIVDELRRRAGEGE